VAVDLDSGAVRWRASGAGRPLLATDAGLLVIRRSRQRIELVLVDPATGELTAELGALPAPDWAAAEWEHPGGIVAAARTDGAPEVVWRAARRYHGGAPPSREVLRGLDDEAGGVVEVDLAGGRLRILTDDPAAADDHGLVEPALSAVETADRVYTLDARSVADGTTAVTLAATPHGDAAPLWETVLDRRAPRRPPPPRP
jgi:hypothetical protein